MGKIYQNPSQGYPEGEVLELEQAVKDSLIDLEEQEDLRKAAKKTQRMVAIIPTRKPGV
ncbi:hypothetical protein AG0111_0g12231 [Alternaria gaisen]|uniref:Uncharacterized protein n=1 Tax=Alternaria gaisen TaxID=167740 RepID=A0ACB6F578_9PLEO|nr:hypothetical protein AG0111_0g12231 [Alternaria gaisen]